ncbi:hypothetical protein [Lacinutrix undariae]
MRFIKKILLFSLLITIFSCSNENENITESQNLEVIKTQFNLNSTNNLRTTKSLDIGLEATFDLEKETLIGFVASEDLLKTLKMSQLELETHLKNEMGDLYYLNDPAFANDVEEDEKKHNHAACIQGCITKYTDENGEKIKGRGACKANCWVSTAVDVIKAAATIISAVA